MGWREDFQRDGQRAMSAALVPPAPLQPGPLAPQYVEGIRKHEGFDRKAFWDYKQYTNGYGTRAKYPGEVIDRATAEQRYNDELGKAAAIVDQQAPNAPEGVKAALTSLTYNSGEKWASSGLGDAVRAGNYPAAEQKFLQYTKAGGSVNPALSNAVATKRNGSKEPP